MNEEIFKFKPWIIILYGIFVVGGIWFVYILFPSAVNGIVNFTELNDLYSAGLILIVVWLVVSEFGYYLMLYLPSGTALQLNSEYIKICTIWGLKTIPKKAVRGCKNPVHRMTRGRNAGLVIISVSPEYRVIGPYGFKINPQFHGASVVGEDEQSMVKKIRAWRKNGDC
jgi:hypothetical protein